MWSAIKQYLIDTGCRDMAVIVLVIVCMLIITGEIRLQKNQNSPASKNRATKK